MTNKCGTLAGYRIHTRKFKETPCEPCREAMRDHWKQQRVERKEEINEKRRAWRARTPGANRSRSKRARMHGGLEGLYSDQDVINAYGTDCHICGGPIDFNAPRQCGKPGWEKAFHVDHVYPLSKGGADTLENVRPSHGQCNIVKWATVYV